MTVDNDRLRKFLATACHPTTNDNVALTAARKAHELLNKAGLSFDDVTTAPADTPVYPPIGSYLRRIESLENLLQEARSDLANERKARLISEAERDAVKKENAAQKQEIAAQNEQIVARNNRIAAQKKQSVRLKEKLAARDEEIAGLKDENAALKEKLAARDEEIAGLKDENAALKEKLAARDEKIAALKEKLAARDEKIAALKEKIAALEATQQPKAANSSDDETLTTRAEKQGLIAAMDKLRQVDSNMRLTSAMAFLEADTHDGLSAAELAEHVSNTSEGSMRYTMRALGQGWPGKRKGHGLIMDCANPQGGRARVYVLTSRGRALRDAVLKAFSGGSRQRASKFRLAA